MEYLYQSRFIFTEIETASAPDDKSGLPLYGFRKSYFNISSQFSLLSACQ